jgi:DMSO reductase family type II enzyme iron-sulfur subunit
MTMAVKRQVAQVMDLNKCIGCQTCSIACKTLWTSEKGQEHIWWNTVNTQPGKGAPKGWEEMGGGWEKDGKPRLGAMPTVKEMGGWEFNHNEIFSEGQGQTDYLRPKGETPTWGVNWEEDVGGGTYPNSYFFYLPRICNHCTHPSCVEACPRSALYKREEDGIVVLSQERCEGYRFCVAACPYKKIYFNPVQGKSQKCIFCFPRVEKGVAPACARQCPGHVRYVGYLDDPAAPIYKLVKQWKVAVPLHPEFGTEPNMFYVPPIGPASFDEQGRFAESQPRIPLDYLRYLFGPAVDEALRTLQSEMAKNRRGEKSELMEVLISRRWIEQFGEGFNGNPALVQVKI